MNELTETVIGSAIEVHRELGPGLLESVYQDCLALELQLRKVPFDRNEVVPVIYKGLEVSAGLRMDFLVDRKLVVELKSVDALLPVHDAQLISYLRLTRCTVGLLINFNVPALKQGLRRRVLNHPDSASLRLGGEDSASLR